MDQEQRKRAKITDSVTRVLLEDGVRHSMDEIAGRVHLSKVTLYKYFGDKDGMYRYVGRRIFEGFAGELRQRYEAEGSAAGRMVACTGVLTRMMAEGYLTLGQELAGVSGDVAGAWEQFRRDSRSVILGLVGQGKRSGLIRDDADDEIIYYYIDMGLAYYESNREYRSRISSDSRFRQAFMAFIWSNIFIDTGGFDAVGEQTL